MKSSCLCLTIAFALMPICGAAEAESAEALKQRIIAQARGVALEDYAYTRSIRTETTQAGKTEGRAVLERWDPSKPSAQRWTLVTIDGQPPNAEQQKSYSKDVLKRRPAYYGRLASVFTAPSTVSIDGKGRTVFHFAQLPKETVMVGDADISANATCDVAIDTSAAVPFADEVHFVSSKAMRIKLLAKIEKFDATTRYRMMPNGKPAPVEMESEMNGSMLGKEGSVHTRIAYSEQRALGK